MEGVDFSVLFANSARQHSKLTMTTPYHKQRVTGNLPIRTFVKMGEEKPEVEMCSNIPSCLPPHCY